MTKQEKKDTKRLSLIIIQHWLTTSYYLREQTNLLMSCVLHKDTSVTGLVSRLSLSLPPDPRHCSQAIPVKRL